MSDKKEPDYDIQIGLDELHALNEISMRQAHKLKRGLSYSDTQAALTLLALQEFLNSIGYGNVIGLTDEIIDEKALKPEGSNVNN